MTIKVLSETLDQLAKQVELAASQIRWLRARIDEMVPQEPEPEPEDGPDGKCLHPEGYRMSAPRMGAPEAFYCRRCEKTIR